MPKVEMINGDTTPVVFCNKLAEVSDIIEDIAVIVNYKDGSTHVFNTVMKNRDMAWFRWFFDQEFRPISVEE
jgi:hypothetical protein